MRRFEPPRRLNASATRPTASSPERARAITWRCWAAATSLGLILGCATIAPKKAAVSDAPLRSAQIEVPRKDGVHATVQQEGTTVRLVASRSCDLVGRSTVLRTTRTEHENKSAGIDWLFAGSGVGFAGAGAVVLVDARGVSDADTSSRKYNPVGPTGATMIGVGGVVVGAGLLTAAIVDVVRANKVTVEEQEITSNGQAVKEDISCTKERAAGAVVRGRVYGSPFDIGKTDAAGKLTVELDAVLDPALDPVWVLRDSPRTAPLLVDGVEVATVDLGALFVVREDRAWQGVVGTVPGCAAPTTTKGCDSLNSFLAKFGSGRHAAEARKAIADGAAAMERLRDEDMWKVRKAYLEACTSKKLDSASEIDVACSAIEGYVTAFPNGIHVKEAQAALKVGRARSAALQAAEERKQKAAEEAERRREKAEEQAEKRREQQEAAKQRAQAAAQRAKCMDACGRACVLRGHDPLWCVGTCEERCQ